MQIQSEFTPNNSSVNSFIEFISSLKFSDIYDKEVSSPNSKIIEVGNMKYKVKQDTDATSLFESNQKKEPISKKHDIEPEKDQINQFEDTVPFVHVNIAPVSSEAFLAQLPTNLYSFIKELVTVVKLHNAKDNSIEYAFKFKQLNLEVMIKKVDDLLKIVIKVGDEALKKELTKDRQDLMASILQSKIETDQIDVEFVFDDYQQKSNSQNNEESNDQNNQQQEDIIIEEDS
tara:strand:- start:179 stop:871 length:693 start_codon:yes stop_codon:yes gene_type:complete